MEGLKLIVTFSTTAGAMEMERLCRDEGVPGRLIPVPGSISAGCGLCWMSGPESRAAVEELTIRRRLPVDGIYELRLRR